MHCNGKCHLMKQLKKANHEAIPEENNTKKTTHQEENTSHLRSHDAFYICPAFVKKHGFTPFLKEKMPSPFSGTIFHPPQA